MTRLYVAGPMTGYKDHNFPAFDAAARKLRAAGFDVENPADTGLVEDWEWADYLRYDLPLLLKCDGVATLDRWHLSKGAQLEVHVALKLDMTVATPSSWVARAEVAA